MKPLFRRFSTLLVCLLIVGVAALATRAKTSQYPHQPGFSRHLCKAVKMSNDRTQKSVAVYSVERPLLLEAPLVTLTWQVAPTPPVRPKQQCFLDSFRYRPPPVLL